jgi:DNA-binding beta-propeller fold protein YncE
MKPENSNDKMKYSLITTVLVLLLIISGCRKDAAVQPHEEEDFPADLSAADFYLLNEGNMGMNKASLDYIDHLTGTYKRNIYNEINPTAPKEMGDVGNDLQVYGAKLYAVINMSDKVEIMDMVTAKRLGQVTIPNCRYITFANGKAYVSSYASALGDANAPEGYIAELDTTTFQVLRKATVGRQPEEMAVVSNKLYIANSGGYSPPDYERTISVVDLNTFKEINRIDVAINLHRIKKDGEGDLYVTSRGDYYNIPSNMYVVDTKTDKVRDSFNIAAANICIMGDSAYIYSVEWSYLVNDNVITYALVNVRTDKVISQNFITDGSEKNIKIPYGLAINPKNRDIYITDAKDYVTPGTLYCFDKTGRKKWSVTTGDIPAHIAFIP